MKKKRTTYRRYWVRVFPHERKSVLGKKVSLGKEFEPFYFFVHRQVLNHETIEANRAWTITEKSTGLSLTTDYPQKMAITLAHDLLKKKCQNAEAFRDFLAISPQMQDKYSANLMSLPVERKKKNR